MKISEIRRLNSYNGSKFNFYNFVLSDGTKDSIDETELLEQDIHMNYNNKEVNSASLGLKTYHNVKLKNVINISDRENALNIDGTKEFLQQFFNSPILTNDNMEYKTIGDFNKTGFVKNNENIIAEEKAHCEMAFGFSTSFNLDKKIAAAMNYNRVDFSNLYNFFGQSIVVDSFNDCGYNATVIKKDDLEPERERILDAFVVSMFKKLDLDDEHVKNRKKLLEHSYPSL